MRADADSFLREASQYNLGALPTEARHPATAELSTLARNNVKEAIRVLREVDVLAIPLILPAAPRIEALREDIKDTLLSRGRIFLCGCGATGRLSISLEVLWRQVCDIQLFENSVVGFMAGGDLALVHSIENFEDHPEYGARQLVELGFGENDLLIATTEGGETPFVIGATEKAAEASRRSPWFLYCNPDEMLSRAAERSRRVLANRAVEKINLHVGPMALSGSTRMQASTVLMLATGLALLGWTESTPILDELNAFLHVLRSADMGFLEPLVIEESKVYQAGGYMLYEADKHGITIVTDTTERSPTFSLRAFENARDANAVPALCYFHMPGTRTAEEAWRALLCREPRTLEWEGVRAVAGRERLLGFDFSDRGAELRGARIPTFQETFRVEKPGQSLEFELETDSDLLRGRFSFAALPILFEHLLLKIALNILSTLVMGRLGRYERNLMTYVRPSNKKLIDRTIRYALHLLECEGRDNFTYEQVARTVFAEMGSIGDDEPIVLRVVQRLLKP